MSTKAAQSTCIICGDPAHENWQYCEKPACRKQASRDGIKAKREALEQTRAQEISAYGQTLLPDTRTFLLELMRPEGKYDAWIVTEKKEKTFYRREIDLADLIMRRIEAERAQAKRELSRYMVVLEQRAERADERVKELEAELHMLRLLLPQALQDTINSAPVYASTATQAEAEEDEE